MAVATPDYILLRRTAAGISVDVVDPLRPDLGDTVLKWRALARYASENAMRLGRVLAVIGSGMGDRLTLEAIDLATDATRDALLRLDERDDIRSVFASHRFRM